jgi:hypothetical protein
LRDTALSLSLTDLRETGLKNLHGIQQLVSFQHILFDFSFYQMECPTGRVLLLRLYQGSFKALLRLF